MLDVDDGSAGVTRGGQQFGDLRECRVEPWQLQYAAAVLLLGVDDQQGRIAQGGGGMAAPCELKQCLRMRHDLTPRWRGRQHSLSACVTLL
ncbi:hypothetical protein D3C80_1743450 [compost metagenome]